MYFESNRSSREGMIAVGSLVMNRVHSEKFPNSVCAVVGQKNQFAPGVMTTHYTLGATYAMAQQSEFTFALTIAPSRSVTGPSMFNGFGMPAGNETIRMRQYGLGVQYAWKF